MVSDTCLTHCLMGRRELLYFVNVKGGVISGQSLTGNDQIAALSSRGVMRDPHKPAETSRIHQIDGLELSLELKLSEEMRRTHRRHRVRRRHRCYLGGLHGVSKTLPLAMRPHCHILYVASKSFRRSKLRKRAVGVVVDEKSRFSKWMWNEDVIDGGSSASYKHHP